MSVDTAASEDVEIKYDNKDTYINDKVDSGMDEDSQQSIEETGISDQIDVNNSSQLTNKESYITDEEEDTISTKHKHTKRIIEDDTDDDQERGEDDGTSHLKEVEPGSEQETEDKDLETILKSRTNEGSSSDSDDNETLLSSLKKKRVLKDFNEDSNDSSKGMTEKKEDNSTEEPSVKAGLFSNNDLFDAEEEEQENSGDEPASDSNKEEDEGFDESSIDPKLLKKLKKGAGKKPTKASKEKSRRDELQNIHSETQRIIRESRVHIPYHQPTPKPLTDFLARASQKQEQYRSLHNTRDLHKAKVMQQMFEKNKKMQDDLEKHLPKEEKNEKANSSDKTDKNDVPPQCNERLESSDKKGSNSSEDREDNSVSAEGDLPDPEDVPPLCERLEKCQELSDISETNQQVLVDKSECSHIVSENCKIESADLRTECSDSINQSQQSDSTTNDTGCQKSTKLHQLLLKSDLPKLSLPPKLSGDSVISLDDNNSEEIPQNPGVFKLMGRLMNHCKKKKHAKKDIDISVVEKDKQELHLSSFTYHPTEEEENSLQGLEAPGAKLMALKEKLQEKMKMRREESRKQRQDMYDLDNEEGGYEAEDEEAILDDDAEMSEHSDTDVEDEEFDEQFEEEEEEREENPFADDEAEEDDEGDCDIEDGDISEGEDFKLRLSDDEEEEENTEDKEEIKDHVTKSATKKRPQRLQISDDEESVDVPPKNTEETDPIKDDSVATAIHTDIPTEPEEDGNKQVVKGECVAGETETQGDMFIPFSSHFKDASQIQEIKKSSSLVPPVEDSQDLYGSTQNVLATCPETQPSQSLYLEESQSQMFDADGFLKMGSTGKKPLQPRSLITSEVDSSQDQYGELLGLCSGRFMDSQDDKKSSCKKLFGGTQVTTQGNMEDLLGLCSGNFGQSNTQKEINERASLKRKSPLDEMEGSNDSFEIASGDEADVYSEKDVLSDDDRNKDADEDEDSKDSTSNRRQKFSGFTVANKHGKIRKEFVDEEAELSGSEYESDENLDLAEEDDMMELEEGDKDVVASEEDLRNQVGRAHLKQMIDEDKRQLMRFQEMYLPDGDLHSEGQGRIRRFKWSNIDDDTQQDMFDNDSDVENHEEEDQDSKWRQQRFEREKFLQEQEQQEKDQDENSQFLKFGRVFLKRRDSDSGSTKRSNLEKTSSTEIASQSGGMFKPSMQKKGSFLGRDKGTLAKIAELTKISKNPTGPRNSKNFVFQVISPEKEANSQNSDPAPTERKIRKAHKPKPQQPAAKKPRLEKSSSFSQSSIFNLI